MNDPIIDWTLFISFAIAIAWVIGNPIVIIVGYYMRDKSQDEEL